MSLRKWFNKWFANPAKLSDAEVDEVVESLGTLSKEDREFLERCAAKPPKAIVSAATSAYFDGSVDYILAEANRKLLTRCQRVRLAERVFDAHGLHESDLELIKALMCYTSLQTKHRLLRRWCKENDLPMPMPLKAPKKVVRVPKRRAKKTPAQRYFEESPD